MDTITAILRIFDPEVKCEACARLGFTDYPVFKCFFTDGTTKKLHDDCRKHEN